MTEEKLEEGARPDSPTGEAMDDLSGLTPTPEGDKQPGATDESAKEPPIENQLGEIRRLIQKMSVELPQISERVSSLEVGYGGNQMGGQSVMYQPAQAQTVEGQLVGLSDEQLDHIIYSDDPDYDHYKGAAKKILRERLKAEIANDLKREEVQRQAILRIQQRGYEKDNPVLRRAGEIAAEMERDPTSFIARAGEIAVIMAEHELSAQSGKTDISEFQRSLAAKQAGEDVGLPATTKTDDIELTPQERERAERWGQDPALVLEEKRRLAAQKRGMSV